MDLLPIRVIFVGAIREFDISAERTRDGGGIGGDVHHPQVASPRDARPGRNTAALRRVASEVVELGRAPQEGCRREDIGGRIGAAGCGQSWRQEVQRPAGVRGRLGPGQRFFGTVVKDELNFAAVGTAWHNDGQGPRAEQLSPVEDGAKGVALVCGWGVTGRDTESEPAATRLNAAIPAEYEIKNAASPAVADDSTNAARVAVYAEVPRRWSRLAAQPSSRGSGWRSGRLLSHRSLMPASWRHV